MLFIGSTKRRDIGAKGMLMEKLMSLQKTGKEKATENSKKKKKSQKTIAEKNEKS
jgi:hypothetical protein